DVIATPVSATPFDVTLTLNDAGASIVGHLDYATDLFDAPTLERYLAHWQVLLEGFVADPAQPVSRLPLLRPAQRRQLLHDFNATARVWPETGLLQQRFEQQVRQHPEATALVHG